MKLHLPKLLRNAVLTCITAVAGVTTTIGTATFTGGLVAVTFAGHQARADWSGDTYYLNSADTNKTPDASEKGDSVTIMAGDAATYDLESLTMKSGQQLLIAPNPEGDKNIEKLTITDLTATGANITIQADQTLALGQAVMTAANKFASIQVEGTLDLTAIGGEHQNANAANFSKNFSKMTGSGTVKLAQGLWLQSANQHHANSENNGAITLATNYVVGGADVEDYSATTGANAGDFVLQSWATGLPKWRDWDVVSGGSLTVGDNGKGILTLLSGNRLDVCGGSATAGIIRVGYSGAGDNIGAVSLSDGGELTVGQIFVQGAYSGAAGKSDNAVSLLDGTVEFTSQYAVSYVSGVAADVTLGGTGDEQLKLVAKTDWGISKETSKTSSSFIVGNVLVDSANTAGITLTSATLTGSIDNRKTLSLAGTTVLDGGSTITNSGSLTLAGTLRIEDWSGLDVEGDATTYSDGENGINSAKYWLVKNAAGGTVDVTNLQLQLGGAPVTCDATGGISFDLSSVYHVRTEVTYDSETMAGLGAFLMYSNARLSTGDATILGKVQCVDSTSAVILDKAEGIIEVGDNNSTYGGNIIISAGTTVKAVNDQDNHKVFGTYYYENRNKTITLEAGAEFDFNGKDPYYKFVLNEGATLSNTGGDRSHVNHMGAAYIELAGNAVVNAVDDFGLRFSGYEPSGSQGETLDLAGYTLTKKGGSNFFLKNTTVTAGTVDIQEGTVWVIGGSGWVNVDLAIQKGAKMSWEQKGSATNYSLKSLVIYDGSASGNAMMEVGNNVNVTVTGTTKADVLLEKLMGGTFKLAGDTTLAGGLKVTAGTVELQGATTLGGLLTIENGATLAMGESATVTISSLAGFITEDVEVSIPETNSLVSMGDTTKIVDNKNADNANNALSKVTYKGTEYTLTDGSIDASAKVYYAVEAGEGKVVTVGGASATAQTNEATEFYVGTNGTLKIAGNASDSMSAAQAIAATTGDGTLQVATSVDMQSATPIAWTGFAGNLKVTGANGSETVLTVGTDDHLSSIKSLSLDASKMVVLGGTHQLSNVGVEKSSVLQLGNDTVGEVDMVLKGVTQIAAEQTLRIESTYATRVNIEALAGQGRLELQPWWNVKDYAGCGLDATVGISEAFTGDIYLYARGNNYQLDIAADAELAAAQITQEVRDDAAKMNVVSLTGAGTYSLGSSTAFEKREQLAEGWTGTVKVTGANVTGTVDMSGLTTSSSTLAISGLTVADGAALTLGGKVNLGGTVSVAESIAANGTLTFGSDLKLSVAAGMITNGTRDKEKVITLITGAGASAVGSMSTAMLSDELLALGVADSWVFNADGTITFTKVNPQLVWGGGDGSLSDSSKYANGATYEDGSDITFGAVTDGNADTITVAASDSIANVTVQTGGNYVFTGTKLNVTDNLSIATGAAVDAQAGLSVGGSLESAGTLKATTIDGAGDVSITGGSLELSGSLANTGTKSISGAELKGSWSATGVSLGTGVTVGEGGTITLTDTTLAGTVTNKGNLTLSGTVNISPSAGFQTQESGVQYSDGANGIKYADVTYTIVTGAGTTTVDNATWQVDGVAKGTYADGKLNVKGAQQGTLYWANSGDVTYTGNMTGATGIALNGGNVALNASLADSMTDGIQVSKAGTVTLGSDATLAATQVNGATAANKVTLDGTGTYDLGSGIELGAGVDLAESWQGTVQVDAASVTAGADLSALGHASSIIGIDGVLTLGTAETAATLNAGSSALALESLTMGNVASSITAGSLVLGDSFALNLTDVLKASQEIAGNTLITLTTALSDADKDKLTGTWKGTGVAGLYDYETSWNGNALVLTGKLNVIIWEGGTESGEGGDDSGFGGSEQTWNSETTSSDDNVAFTGNCAGGNGEVNVAGGDTTGAVEVGSVTVTDIESTGTSYTFMGGSINAEGNLVVGTVDEEEVETKGELTISNNSTFKGSATVTASSSLAVSGVTTDDAGNTTTTDASLTVGSLTAAGSVSVGDSGSLTVTGDLTIEDASEEEGTKGGSLSISSTGSLAAGVTTTTDAEGTTQAATGKLSVDKITITGTLQDNAATLVTVGNLEKDVVIDLEDATTLKNIAAGTFNLMSILGNVKEVTLDADDLQAILAKGLGCDGLSSTGGATTFSLRRTLAPVPTDIYLEVRELTPDELIWDTNDDSSTGGLNIVDKVNDDGSIVLKDNSILDTILTVDVAEDTTIDLSSTDDTDTVNIKGLTGEKNLTIVGNGDDVNVTTGAKYDGALVLSDVAASVSGQYGSSDSALGSGTLEKKGVLVGKDATAELDVEDSLVVLDGGSLSGDSAMDGGALAVKSTNAAIVEGNIKVDTGDSLTVSGTDIAIVGNATDSMVLDVKSTGKHVIADLGKVKGNEGEVAIVDEANKSIAVMDKYFTNTRLENGKVVADRNSSYYSDKAGESVSANGAEGLAMADAVLVKLNPQATAPKSALATVLTTLDTAKSDAADELGASLAGASTAVLGMAVSGDVDRQLQAIRNRTTTMGVDQSVANEDMPYFNAWINAEGDRSELSESGTEGGYELSSWGGTVGFDVDLCPTFTAGMALTAMYGDIDTTGADKASGNIDTYYVTAFARYAPSAWTHTFVATVGMSDISLDRHVAGYEMEGETDGLSFGLMYEVGRVFALTEDGSTCLQPVFNVTWKHTAIDAYTEDGSDLALEVDEQTLDTVTFGLGARLQTVVGESMYNRTSILEARVLAKADVGDRSGSSDVALAALPEANGSVDSAEMGAFGLEAGAGLTIPVGQEGGSIFMDASVELRSDYTNVNGTVGYRVNF